METGVPILTLISAPSVEPVTLTDAKNFAHVTWSDDDTLFGTLITAARMQVEALTRRLCITQTWDLVMDLFPGLWSVPSRPFQMGPLPYGLTEWAKYVAILVPWAPVQSVSFIKYFDLSGVQQTLGSSLYSVDKDSLPARIVPSYGNTWPPTQPIQAAVRVEFVAGYGNAGSNVDARMLLCIMELVRSMHRYREPAIDAALSEVGAGFWNMIQDLKLRIP